MRTFYDFREADYANQKKFPLEGYVILKNKYFWLCWIYKDKNHMNSGQLLKGYIVAPRTIYLHNVYIAKSFWDGLKYFLKKIYNGSTF